MIKYLNNKSRSHNERLLRKTTRRNSTFQFPLAPSEPCVLRCECYLLTSSFPCGTRPAVAVLCAERHWRGGAEEARRLQEGAAEAAGAALPAGEAARRRQRGRRAAAAAADRLAQTPARVPARPAGPPAGRRGRLPPGRRRRDDRNAAGRRLRTLAVARRQRSGAHPRLGRLPDGTHRRQEVRRPTSSSLSSISTSSTKFYWILIGCTRL